jgi:hypothetical protein
MTRRVALTITSVMRHKGVCENLVLRAISVPRREEVTIMSFMTCYS